jgi:hypothetical protein
VHLRLLAVVAVVTGILAGATSETARADGRFVWKKAADLKEPTQRAIISWDGETETLILAVKYEGEAEDFAWLVPLPSKPDVKAIDADKNPFAELSRYTQVRVGRARGGMGGGAPAADEVEVIQRKVAGVYDIAILAAKDPDALANWLRKNGYVFSDEHKDTLDHYTRKEWVYAALRIDPKQLSTDEAKKLKTGELQPVRFTFATKEMVYPLKISSGNAGQTEVLLYLLANAPMVQASGPAAKGLEPDAIVPRFSRGPLLDPTYATPRSVTARQLPLTWNALGLAQDAARHLVKYRAFFTPESMKDDLTFKPFDAMAYWKARLEKAGAADTPGGAADRLDCRRFLAVLPQADDPVLLALATDEDTITRRTLASNPGARPEQFQKLALDADAGVREALATNAVAPVAVRARLAADPSNIVRRYVAAAPLAQDVLRRLAGDSEVPVRCAVARNPVTGADLLRALAADKDTQVRADAASNPGLPDDLVPALAKDAEPLVRASAAKSAKATPALLATLAQDENTRVQSSVAGNPATPPETLARLAQKFDESVLDSLARRPNATPELLRAVAGCCQAGLAAVARNPQAPVDVLKDAARSVNNACRQAVAQNPNTPVDLLKILAGDATSEVTRMAKENLDRRAKP